MRPHRILIPAALAILILGTPACSSDSPEDLRAQRISLVSSRSCGELLAWIKAQARERVGPYGFEGGGAYRGDVAADVAGTGLPTTSGSLESRAQAADEAVATGTNNQEISVDEIDRVKTDGRRLVVVNGNRLEVLDITGPAPRPVGSIELPSSDGRLFLRGDKVLVVGPSMRSSRQQVTLVEVDLSGEPKISARRDVDGWLIDGRMTTQGIRLVVSTNPALNLPFISPNGPAAEDLARRTNRALIDRTTISDWLPTISDGSEETPLLDCAAVYHSAERGGGGDPSPSAASMLSVLSIGSGLGDMQAIGVIADGQTVYASETGLYVATTAWTGEEVQTAVHRFDISVSGPAVYQGSGAVPGHLLNQYAMSEREGVLRIATTVGGGMVRPMPIDDVPVARPEPAGVPELRSEPSEGGAGAAGQAGSLREGTEATTVPDPDEPVSSPPLTEPGEPPADTVPEPQPLPEPIEPMPTDPVPIDPVPMPTEPVPTEPVSPDAQSRSMVSALALVGDRLELIGRVDGLGVGEDIQAVRYLEDKAYVVTFRQIDPLYVIDLADPRNPRLLGELKEPGFSAYLHPVGPGRMLGIGSAGDEDGRILGVKVALYDTTDPTSPRVLTSAPVDSGYATVSSDPKAFTWDPARRLAVVPMYRTVQGRSESGAAVYRVDDAALVEVAFIRHSTDGSFGIDRVPVTGDRLFAVSWAGVSQHTLDSLACVGWVGFSATPGGATPGGVSPAGSPIEDRLPMPVPAPPC